MQLTLPPLIDCPSEISDRVLDVATDLHSTLGPGMFENIYKKALLLDLNEAGLLTQAEVGMDIIYKGRNLGMGYSADLVVEGRLVLELKSVDKLHPAHLAQIMTYQRTPRIKRGYLLNFGANLMKEGIRRVSI